MRGGSVATICGFLPVRKPAGPTSAVVVAQVKRLTGADRAGHSGTLDPGAAGVLVVALGRATGLLPFLPQGKSYRAEVRLGQTTDTQDAQGRVLRTRPVPPLTRERVERELAALTGDILQRPPRISALKRDGRPLYAWARVGRPVDVPPRPVRVDRLALLVFAPPRLELEVECGAGTYVRTLAADLGELLGCGAHLTALTRTVCNGVTLARAVGLDELTELAAVGRWTELLLTPAAALAHLPAVTATSVDLTTRVVHGNPLDPAPLLDAQDGLFRVLDPDGRLAAVARREGNALIMERVLIRTGEDAACA